MKMASRSIDLICKKSNLHVQHTFFLLISKNTNLHVQHTFFSNFAKKKKNSFVFLCRCFARLQYRFIRLKRQTSLLHIIFTLWRNCRMYLPKILFPVFMFTFVFSLPLIFTLLAASISHFLTSAMKFSCFSSNDIFLLCFQSLALALSLLST